MKPFARRRALLLPTAGVGCLAMALVTYPTSAAEHGGRKALADAARATVLPDLDSIETQCRPQRTVEAWLTELTSKDAKAIIWSGGRCRLVNRESPLDRGGQWCGQATIVYPKPLDAKDKAAVEIFFDGSTASHPGKAFAFRGTIRGPDGWEYVRSTSDFEALWKSRFPGDTANACPAGEDIPK